MLAVGLLHLIAGQNCKFVSRFRSFTGVSVDNRLVSLIHCMVRYDNSAVDGH